MTTATSNSIIGISTNSFGIDHAVNKQYVDSTVVLPTLSGNSGKFLYSTDGVSQSWQELSNTVEYTAPGEYSFSVLDNANLFFIEVVGVGAGGGAGTINGNSGAGGGAGSYTSWYVPTSIISSSTLTIQIGSGGSGGSSSGATGSSGAGTTITWSGPGGTYALISNGGGPTSTGGTAQTVSTYRPLS